MIERRADSKPKLCGKTSRSNIRRLVESGEIIRTARGLYRLSEKHFSENISLAEVATLAPRAVFCLFTALVFHKFTVQVAPEVCIAIEGTGQKPKISTGKTRVYRFSGDVFGSGIEEHRVDGVKIRVYSPAKTVADCFKMRNKVGLDVAIEALRTKKQLPPKFIKWLGYVESTESFEPIWRWRFFHDKVCNKQTTFSCGQGEQNCVNYQNRL